MPFFHCRSCYAVYEDYYPPDDSCFKCNKGPIRIITHPSSITQYKEKPMTAITPELKLFTHQEDISDSIHIGTLNLIYRGNHYHFNGGTGDTIHVFTQSIAIYVLTVNKGLGKMALNAFMVPQPDAINGIYLHSPQEITDHLGADWEQYPPETIVDKLMDYLF